MTADDTAPPIRLDRYIALLAILLAFVLGLLIISEQQRAMDPNRIEGAVPPREALIDRLERERQALLAEQARLAEALAPTEQALRSVESEVGELAKQVTRFHGMLGEEAMQSRELAERMAVVEADRDQLAAKVDRLMATQDALTLRLREIEASATAPEPLPEPAAGGDPSTEPGRAMASRTTDRRCRRCLRRRPTTLRACCSHARSKTTSTGHPTTSWVRLEPRARRVRPCSTAAGRAE